MGKKTKTEEMEELFEKIRYFNEHPKEEAKYVAKFLTVFFSIIILAMLLAGYCAKVTNEKLLSSPNVIAMMIKNPKFSQVINSADFINKRDAFFGGNVVRYNDIDQANILFYLHLKSCKK